MSTEKLEKRAAQFLEQEGCIPSAKLAVAENHPAVIQLAEFARAELQKALEIAEEADTNYDAVEAIRKLME